MDNLTRLHYLKAMGVDVWLPKNAHGLLAQGQNAPVDIGVGEVNVIPEQPQAYVDATANRPVSQLASDNWDCLQAEVSACTLCGLCGTRTQTVFGAGSKTAEWMIVGEAPGQGEDQQGLPFVGTTGLLLTEMLRAIGLSREEVFITNSLKCAPPDNRDPQPEEVSSCNAYLQRQIALVKPKIILALGRFSAQILLGTDQPIGHLRGKVHALNNTPVIVVYHPAYLLSSPAEKAKAWLDLQLAVQTYKT